MISRSLFVENKNLRIFDFDDTLVKTKSFIYITHSNGKKSKLTPAQYATYTEKPGDVYDFSDFEQVKQPEEIKRITNVLRKVVQSSKEPVYILTARSAAQPIKQYLKDIGINSNKINVVALASNNPKDKADWIEDMIDNAGYDDIYFADDSQKNVDAAKQMLRRKDVKWRVQHIKH
jgi:HAD superfamily hydrolase (TIGR01509 family)